MSVQIGHVDWLFLAPMAREANVVSTVLEQPHRLDVRHIAFGGQFAGRSAILVETGIGQHRAGAAIREALGVATPLRAVLVGIAGALDPDLRTGDIVVANRVRDLPTDQTIPVEPIELPKSKQCTILTTDSVIVSPQLKHALHEQTGAHAVDMESHAIARACIDHGVGVTIVRAIFDDAHSSVDVRLSRLVDGFGNVRFADAFRTIARSPAVVFSAVRLARNLRRAERALKMALHQWRRTL